MSEIADVFDYIEDCKSECNNVYSRLARLREHMRTDLQDLEDDMKDLDRSLDQASRALEGLADG